jgi:hypothetical protein
MFFELAKDPSEKFELEIRNSGNSEISKFFDTRLTSLRQSEGSMFGWRIMLSGLNLKFSVSVLNPEFEIVSGNKIIKFFNNLIYFLILFFTLSCS